MGDIILIALSAFLASFLSFYSGFGLGTILMPVTAIFLPLPIAIGLTAIVHLIHNLLKVGLLWKSIHWKSAFQFGIPALLAAIPGALLLQWLNKVGGEKPYTLFCIHAKFSVLHFLIGLLLIFFALRHKKIRMQNIRIGGALSGFLGGLSGFQGAFRSLFLLNVNLQPSPFIATNAIIAVVIDAVRLTIYVWSFSSLLLQINGAILISAGGAAICGVALGFALLKKVTHELIQKVVMLLLVILGACLMLGII
ncbi:MAG: sulfite exporter TauE/SafE family protein [Parachlamydiales bacterium]|nr:sulfite exporter TauE/SafE family protein [Parachlamydiales bacterium]